MKYGLTIRLFQLTRRHFRKRPPEMRILLPLPGHSLDDSELWWAKYLLYFFGRGWKQGGLYKSHPAVVDCRHVDRRPLNATSTLKSALVLWTPQWIYHSSSEWIIATWKQRQSVYQYLESYLLVPYEGLRAALQTGVLLKDGLLLFPRHADQFHEKFALSSSPSPKRQFSGVCLIAFNFFHRQTSHIKLKNCKLRKLEFRLTCRGLSKSAASWWCLSQERIIHNLQANSANQQAFPTPAIPVHPLRKLQICRLDSIHQVMGIVFTCGSWILPLLVNRPKISFAFSILRCVTLAIDPNVFCLPTRKRLFEFAQIHELRSRIKLKVKRNDIEFQIEIIGSLGVLLSWNEKKSLKQVFFSVCKHSGHLRRCPPQNYCNLGQTNCNALSGTKSVKLEFSKKWSKTKAPFCASLSIPALLCKTYDWQLKYWVNFCGKWGLLE